MDTEAWGFITFIWALIILLTVPFIIAALLNSVFALPYWPCYWLGVLVFLLVRG